MTQALMQKRWKGLDADTRYATTDGPTDIIKVFPYLKTSYRVHKYSQPKFLKVYFYWVKIN